MNKDISTIIPFFADDRGSIASLIPDGVVIKSILLITCKKGSIRANHYHKKDTHYSYMIKGSMEYFTRDLDSNAEPEKVIVKEGEMVYTPSMKVHAMRFLEDSVFLALATEMRPQNKYEEDLVRVKLI